ncbi:hypothetical protein BU14_1768s0001 [Porphyra umbilicalis]|uniref:Uncharacterized protein n=1 Tax=Porphyra umbilicalis TaxID=2786 RepID=A0A1X6NKT6_PORUM|nr:hypothetical protein BU14_1768s0001 [Porphyra umbilicalis]|eukprot:OSX69182.1 hypothetical protein BU14_1768s0001 [Porphyra umbilicalis]
MASRYEALCSGHDSCRRRDSCRGPDSCRRRLSLRRTVVLSLAAPAAPLGSTALHRGKMWGDEEKGEDSSQSRDTLSQARGIALGDLNGERGAFALRPPFHVAPPAPPLTPVAIRAGTPRSNELCCV